MSTCSPCMSGFSTDFCGFLPRSLGKWSNLTSTCFRWVDTTNEFVIEFFEAHNLCFRPKTIQKPASNDLLGVLFVMLLFNFLGLFEVIFLGFYHDKSPLFHFQVAVGEDFFFSKHQTSKSRFWKDKCVGRLIIMYLNYSEFIDISLGPLSCWWW